jgi:hypothetical protein
MAKRVMIKRRNTLTFNRSGKEFIRAVTNFLILGIAFILLKGLNALKVLNDFKLKLVATKSNILNYMK